MVRNKVNRQHQGAVRAWSQRCEKFLWSIPSLSPQVEASTNVQALDEASKLNFDYTMKCTITLWEDNATAWSGKGDKLEISVEVFDVKTKQLVGIASHYRVATGFTLVSGTPDRFMDECAEGALGKIYGWE